MMLALLGFTPLPKKDLAPQPVLGFNSWNAFMGDISDEKIRKTADLMVEKGLLAAGYEYLIIDDGYLLKERGENDELVIDREKFPYGMKDLADYVHSKGLKFGMYNSAGTYTCMGLAGSFGYEDVDARAFAEFGVDYLKYDFCNNPIIGGYEAADVSAVLVGDCIYVAYEATVRGQAHIEDDLIKKIGNSRGEATFEIIGEGDQVVTIRYVENDSSYRVLIAELGGEEFPLLTRKTPPGHSFGQVSFNYSFVKGTKYLLRLKMDLNDEGLAKYSYMRMGNALIESGRDITFGICEWGSNSPFKWAEEIGHNWRTSGDITSTQGACKWNSILACYETTAGLYNYSSQNAHNDPDMLCVGLRGINEGENRAHLTLWAMTNAPLLIGADLSIIEDEYIELLKNKYILRVNQDKLNKQAMPVVKSAIYEILIKELDDGTVALVFLNKDSNKTTISYDLKEIMLWFDLPNFEACDFFELYDVFNDATINIGKDFTIHSAEVSAHDVAFYIVSAK